VLSTYGRIDLTPVPESNPEPLRAKRTEIRTAYAAAVQRHGQENVEANRRQGERSRWSDELVDVDIEIADLEKQLGDKRRRKTQVQNFLVEFPAIEIKPAPVEPDTAQLDAQIEEATRNQERARQLEENKTKAAKRDREESELGTAVLRIKAIKAEKIAKLKEVGEKCGISELEFDEHGNFTYQGCQAGMLSTSQLMKLSSQLSALYPEGLGVELIDRAESLGKSIFGFIDEAKEKKRTILATIVGNAPARVPEHVGVFVVEKGKVKKAKVEYQPSLDDVPTP
jgi:hypothetical protein